MTTEDSPNCIQRFKFNVTALINCISDIMHECHALKLTDVDPEIIKIAGDILSGVDDNVVIENFIIRSHHTWNDILPREETFFFKNCSTIFEEIPKLHIDTFVKLFSNDNDQGKSAVSDDDKRYIWDLVHGMVRLSIKHIHERRCPAMRITTEGQPETRVYLKDYMKNIKIQPHAKNWNIALIWPA